RRCKIRDQISALAFKAFMSKLGGTNWIRTRGSIRETLPLKTRQNFALQSPNWGPEKFPAQGAVCSRSPCLSSAVAVRFFRIPVLERRADTFVDVTLSRNDPKRVVICDGGDGLGGGP